MSIPCMGKSAPFPGFGVVEIGVVNHIPPGNIDSVWMCARSSRGLLQRGGNGAWNGSNIDFDICRTLPPVQRGEFPLAVPFDDHGVNLWPSGERRIYTRRSQIRRVRLGGRRRLAPLAPPQFLRFEEVNAVRVEQVRRVQDAFQRRVAAILSPGDADNAAPPEVAVVADGVSRAVRYAGEAVAGCVGKSS